MQSAIIISCAICINKHCINQCHWQLLSSSSSSSELSAPASASIHTSSISVIDSYYPEHEHQLLASEFYEPCSLPFVHQSVLVPSRRPMTYYFISISFGKRPGMRSTPWRFIFFLHHELNWTIKILLVSPILLKRRHAFSNAQAGSQRIIRASAPHCAPAIRWLDPRSAKSEMSISRKGLLVSCTVHF